MPTIVGAELQADRFISADPLNGLLASINSDNTVSNIVTRDLGTGDISWLAPANNTGTNTRRHLFDRPIVATSTLAVTGRVTATDIRGLSRMQLQEVATGQTTNLTNNLFFDGVSWKHIVAASGTLLQTHDLGLDYYTAVSAAAGAAATLVKQLGITASGITVPGRITAAGGIQITGGAFAAGSIYKDNASGLHIIAVAGSSYDFAISNPSGASSYILVPTGTTQVWLPQSGGLRVDGIITFGAGANTGRIRADSTQIWIDNNTNAYGLFLNQGASWGGGLRGNWDAFSNFTVGGALAVTGKATLSGQARVGTGLALYCDTSIGPWIAGNTDTDQTSTVAAAAIKIAPNANGLEVFSSPTTAVGTLRTWTQRFIVSVDGQILVGTALASGANPGDVVLASNKYLRGVNGAGTTTLPVIGLDGNNHISIGSATASSGVVLPGVSTASAIASTLAPGDLALAATKAIRIPNAAGTTTNSALRTDSGNTLILGSPGFDLYMASNQWSAAGDQLVTRGAVDSAGVGFRALRVPN